MALHQKRNHFYVVQPVSAQNGRAVQPFIALRIGLHDFADMRDHRLPVVVRIGIGFFHFTHDHLLIQSHRDRIHLYEFHSVGVVHVQRLGEFLGHITKQRSIHSPVHFIQHQQIGLFEDRDLLADLRALILTDLGSFIFHQCVELPGIGESETNGVKL